MNNYHPMNFDPCSNCVYSKNNINMMNTYASNMPMVPQKQEHLTAMEPLEMLYPEIYHKLYPLIRQHCDMKEQEHNMMYTPCKDDIDKMAEDICMKIDTDIEVEVKEKKHHHHRQSEIIEDSRSRKRPKRYGSNQMLNDLVKILLIRELIGRRRPHHYWGY